VNKLNTAPRAYTFDDFILAPVYSAVKSRKDPSVQTQIKDFNFSVPIVSAPMHTVTEEKMAVAMVDLGGVAVIHRYMGIESQVQMAKNLTKRSSLKGIYFAVGLNSLLERSQRLYDVGARNFCIDVANGHNANCIKAVEIIREMFSDALIMSGNVATFDGALKLAEAGTNSIRVGIGSGSVCTTRMVTGHGVPQLSAIEDCVRIKTCQNLGYGGCTEPQDGYTYSTTKAFPNVAIIADGGIRSSSDIVKSIAIGADAVMMGSMLAGTEEAPGEFLEENGQLYKYYHGMASDAAREKWFNKTQMGLPSEGISIKIPYTGRSAKKIIESMCKSLQIGLSYSGATNLTELRYNAKWVKITSSGYTEGTPHGKK